MRVEGRSSEFAYGPWRNPGALRRREGQSAGLNAKIPRCEARCQVWGSSDRPWLQMSSELEWDRPIGFGSNVANWIAMAPVPFPSASHYRTPEEVLAFDQ